MERLSSLPADPRKLAGFGGGGWKRRNGAVDSRRRYNNTDSQIGRRQTVGLSEVLRMSLHLKLLGCLGHAVIDVRSGAATSKCGLPLWRPHSVVQMFIIHGSADVEVASAAVRPERSVCLAL